MAFTPQQAREAWRDMLEADDSLGRVLDKPSLQAAVVAADNWATANAASFNAALPEPFKSTATAGQKAELLAFVALKRWRG
jgi:hypothetical protein